jgi:hypothetical protein
MYLDTAVEGSQLYFYNTEGDRNSVVSQASYIIDLTHKRACPHQEMEEMLENSTVTLR